MVEDEDEDLVPGVEQVGHKPVEREPCIIDALPVHALAHIEHHPHAERHAVACKVRHALLHAILEHLEILARKVTNQTPVLIDHRDGHLDEIDTGTENVVVWRATSLRADAGGRDQNGTGQNDRHEQQRQVRGGTGHGSISAPSYASQAEGATRRSEQPR